MYKSYFEWICQLIEYPFKKASYVWLLEFLYDTEFTYTLPMDENRAKDGIDLRYRFGYEQSYKRAEIVKHLDDRPCSVLEMMAALAIRCEKHIMDDPDIGNRTGKWFWDMIVSLGLENMDDSAFDERRAKNIISRFLKRKYRHDGKGGLFTVSNCSYDMRMVEIWYQMCWYLDEIL